MVSSTYSWPYFWFILATTSEWSIILILVPGVLARSVTAAVGRPPTQKKASILLSFMALTDSATPSRSRLTSLSLSMPAASRMRKAITSVALPGEPVEMCLPFRSASLLTPRALDRHQVHAVRIQHHQRAQRDLVALELVLALERVEAGIGHREADIGLVRCRSASGCRPNRRSLRPWPACPERTWTARPPGRRPSGNTRRRCRRCRSRCSGRSPPTANARAEIAIAMRNK